MTEGHILLLQDAFRFIYLQHLNETEHDIIYSASNLRDSASNFRDSASNLTIKSFNVNSIGKNPKRQDIFKFLNKKMLTFKLLLILIFLRKLNI